MNLQKTPKAELDARLAHFMSAMDEAYPEWELAAFTGSMSIFYLTGTICDGTLTIKRGGGGATLWARRSYERAVLESELSDIRPMKSFRDLAADIGTPPETLYLDMSAATMEWYSLLGKYLTFGRVLPIDGVMLSVRAVKSVYELGFMQSAGKTLDRLLREEVPKHLRAGVSEAELCAELYTLFVKHGHHGLSRFAMRNSDVVLGHVGFGETPLYPSVFNGASGMVGLCPGSPVLGSRERRLCEGDLIYVDIGYGEGGYNVDKTLVYSFKTPQPEHVSAAHAHCLELERLAASMLKPGAAPSAIFSAVMDAVKPEYRDSFMGAPGRTVPFLGHGVGLYIDEQPVIAKGFDAPLEQGMTIAIEPKIGISGSGMVGSENTYLVTDGDAVCITGTPDDILVRG